jgi:hypothetical protein
MDLKTIATADLAAELDRREKNKDALRRRREQLLKEIARIDAQLGEEPSLPNGHTKGRGGRSGVRRAKNPISLADALAGSMEIRAVVTPTEAARLVQENGYQTNSKRFNMMVSNTLAKDPRFRRVERGRYERIS